MNLDSWASLFSAWPTDWIVIGAFAAFASLDALRSGTARSASVIFALPATAILFEALQKAALLGKFLGPIDSQYAQLAILVAIFTALYIVIHRICFTYSDGLGVMQSILVGLAAAAVVTVFWLQLPALQSLFQMGPQVQLIFGEGYRFWWLAAAFATLAFVRR